MEKRFFPVFKGDKKVAAAHVLVECNLRFCRLSCASFAVPTFNTFSFAKLTIPYTKQGER